MSSTSKIGHGQDRARRRGPAVGRESAVVPRAGRRSGHPSPDGPRAARPVRPACCSPSGWSGISLIIWSIF